MLALRLLGGLALENPDRISLGRAAQRRRLALLAVLASPAGSPISRERLVGLLWPDVPPDDARHRLSVALYDVRQVLGEDAISLNNQSVVLKPGALSLDVADFEAAVARGDWEAAVAMYTGPFLDAVYLSDSPGFEEWVEERRSTLKRTVVRALEMVAALRAQRGDRDAAVDAWRRLTQIDPYSGRFAAGLMRALDAAGDRASGLRHAADHSERVRTDLDAEPSSDVEQLASELRRSPTAQPTQARSTLGDGISSRDDRQPRRASLDETVAQVAPRRAVQRAMTVGVILIILASATPAARLLSSRAQPQPYNGLTSRSTSEARSRAASEGEAHMRSGQFDQAVTVYERAVTQDTAFALGHFRLAVATLWADQPGSNLDAPLERAVAYRNELDEQTRALLDGFVAWRRGHWNRAEHLYRRALTIDTASIEARHQLGETLLHYNTPQGRSVAEARAEFERVVALDPRHYGALWHLAQLAAQDGRDGDVVALSNRLLALQPDPVRQLEVEALRAVVAGDSADVDRVMRQLYDADESLLLGTGWRLAIFARRLEAAERVFAILTDSRRGPYARRLGHTQLFHVAVARGRRANAEAQLRALSALHDAGAQPEELAVLLAVAAPDASTRPALRVSRDAIVQRAVLQPDAVGSAAIRLIDEHATLGKLHALLGDSLRANAIATQLETALPFVRADSAMRAAATSRAAAIRALQARHAGRAEDVIQWVDKSLSYRWFSDGLADPHLAYSLERYLRGEALLALGRTQEAESWFATIGQHDVSDLVFLRPALLRRAELAAARGDSAVATKFRADAKRLTL